MEKTTGKKEQLTGQSAEILRYVYYKLLKDAREITRKSLKFWSMIKIMI